MSGVANFEALTKTSVEIGTKAVVANATVRTKADDDVEFATMAYVDWFNHRRLHGTISPGAGRRPTKTTLPSDHHPGPEPVTK